MPHSHVFWNWERYCGWRLEFYSKFWSHWLIPASMGINRILKHLRWISVYILAGQTGVGRFEQISKSSGKMQYLILLTLLERSCLLHAMNNVWDIFIFSFLSEVADIFFLANIFSWEIINVIVFLIKRCPW